MSKILILKNDRAGDLFTSLKLISTLLRDFRSSSIYMSELNYSFSFFFKKCKVKKLNYNLNFFDKMRILFDMILNSYDRVYILSPKNFFFTLPFLFRKTKFYAIVYDGKKRDRPSKFLRKFLFKYKIVSRKKINKFSYRQLQEQLIDEKVTLDDDCNNLNIPKINSYITKMVPKNYIFFQFRYKFFNDLNWSKENIIFFLNLLKKKYENVLFCSDIEDNSNNIQFKNFFSKNYSWIDINNNTKYNNPNSKNIYYLNELKGIDMFHIIKNSTICLAKEGIVSHICYFHNVKCHNLFNFKINCVEDINHQKISYSEWCKDMKFNFSFLNNDFDKTILKLKKQIL